MNAITLSPDETNAAITALQWFADEHHDHEAVGLADNLNRGEPNTVREDDITLVEDALVHFDEELEKMGTNTAARETAEDLRVRIYKEA